MTLDHIKSLILDVPDFPKPGIVFKDITPLLSDASGFTSTIARLAASVVDFEVDGLLAIESRGFIFGAALAQQFSMPLHLVRKSGRLPRDVARVSYELEYGVEELEIHTDSIRAGGRYLIIDDVLATGGTAAATARLVHDQGGTVAACVFVIELAFLNGRQALGDCPVVSLISY